VRTAIWYLETEDHMGFYYPDLGKKKEGRGYRDALPDSDGAGIGHMGRNRGIQSKRKSAIV